MSKTTRGETPPDVQPPADQETSLLRVLVYPLLMFLVGPALLALLLKYLFGA